MQEIVPWFFILCYFLLREGWEQSALHCGQPDGGLKGFDFNGLW